MTEISECPFCSIVDSDDPDAREVYRDDTSIAFFPTEPAVLGHTLIIPRVHVPFLWDLSTEDARHIGLLISRMSRVVMTTTGAEGLNLIQSNGAVATQTVDHIHFHLVPRWENDSIGRIWPPETGYSESQKDAVWESLRGACRKIHL